jgi:flagellar hook-associated protein 1 FlgK
MNLASALHAAVSGLRATQVGMDVVAQNVANAGSAGYTRRTTNPVQSLIGEQTSGVKLGVVERTLDTILQKHLRLETSGAAYTSTMARFATELDKLFGEPGSVGALDTSLNTFTAKLQALAADPGAFSARSGVLDAAGALASHIAAIAETVQALRSEAEGRIATGLGRANDLLKGIGELDGNIRATLGNNVDPGLLDERDRLITELSQLMDVQVMTASNGGVTLTTTGGLTLFNGGTPVKFTFDARGKLGPEAVYSANDSERGVGKIVAETLGGMTIDVLAHDLIRAGEIGAAIDLRDDALVQVQRQLDELAAGLSRALSDRQVAGIATPPGPPDGFTIDLTGLQAGNAVTIEYRANGAGGATRRIVLMPTDGPATIVPGDTADPSATIIPFDRSLGFAGAVAAVQAELTARSINLAVDVSAPNTLRVLDDGVANTTDVSAVSAGITVTTTDSGENQLPFFIDSGANNRPFTGAFENGHSQLRGFAQRIRVNPNLQANRGEALVKFAASTPQGDTKRPLFLVDALTSRTQTFSAAAEINGRGGAYVTTVTDFVRRVVEAQGANAEAAQRLDEGQSIALAAVEARFAEKSGVNVDQEMAQLVQLQTAYGANARVMTAIRDMFDILMRI